MKAMAVVAVLALLVGGCSGAPTSVVDEENHHADGAVPDCVGVGCECTEPSDCVTGGDAAAEGLGCSSGACCVTATNACKQSSDCCSGACVCVGDGPCTENPALSKGHLECQ